ncbi:hypothetical protein CHU98_g8654 [Xylaria longipes]|nr:hypothetical protein CHU98_g8654 [Xylaria longipes]
MRPQSHAILTTVASPVSSKTQREYTQKVILWRKAARHGQVSDVFETVEGQVMTKTNINFAQLDDANSSQGHRQREGTVLTKCPPTTFAMSLKQKLEAQSMRHGRLEWVCHSFHPRASQSREAACPTKHRDKRGELARALEDPYSVLATFSPAGHAGDPMTFAFHAEKISKR